MTAREPESIWWSGAPLKSPVISVVHSELTEISPFKLCYSTCGLSKLGTFQVLASAELDDAQVSILPLIIILNAG
jgi:hypothetical protein